MDHNQDERIVCVGCGESFLFTAAEAAHYAGRGLAAPPKRCRECRRARKEHRQEERRPPNNGPGRSADARDSRAGRPRGGADGGRMPSHTGDVNEYRSPMQVGPPTHDYRSPMQGGSPSSEYRGPMQGGFQPRLGRQGNDRFRARGPRPINDGNYRAPAFRDFEEQGRTRGRPGSRTRGSGPPRPEHRGGARSEPRPRVMFSITCNACGAESQVPFKPDEGREVFCQVCYRARKPSGVGGA